jgi:hypothetical protein
MIGLSVYRRGNVMVLFVFAVLVYVVKSVRVLSPEGHYQFLLVACDLEAKKLNPGT